MAAILPTRVRVECSSGTPGFYSWMITGSATGACIVCTYSIPFGRGVGTSPRERTTCRFGRALRLLRPLQRMLEYSSIAPRPRRTGSAFRMVAIARSLTAVILFPAKIIPIGTRDEVCNIRAQFPTDNSHVSVASTRTINDYVVLCASLRLAGCGSASAIIAAEATAMGDMDFIAALIASTLRAERSANASWVSPAARQLRPNSSPKSTSLETRMFTISPNFRCSPGALCAGHVHLDRL